MTAITIVLMATHHRRAGDRDRRDGRGGVDRWPTEGRWPMKQFTNAELIEEFTRVYEQCQDDMPGLKFRLEELSAEISRRERLGKLGEDDWKLPRH
jgi:hypothetical protein